MTGVHIDVQVTNRTGLVPPFFLALMIAMLGCASAPLEKNSLSMARYRNRLDYPEQWKRQAPFRFLVLGDTQNPKPGRMQNDTERRAIYGRLAEALADSVPVVHVGDIVENGSKLWQWQKFFDSIFWERLSADQKQRFFPLLGNHEYKTHFFDYGGGDLGLYYQRFPHIETRRYYFFEYGDACFISMDSGRNGIMKHLGGERWQNGVEEQLAWLEEEVFPFIRRRSVESGLKRIFFFYHKPGYVTPVDVKNEQSVEMLKRFDDFNRENDYRFEIVAFSGHIHTFSHIVKDYNEDGRGEIDHFTLGIGGGPQRGGKYYKKVKRVEDLDSYRRMKYRERNGEGEFDQKLFDELRFDSTHFGYLEVIIDDEVRVLYHRFDPDSEGFYVDYEFAR